MANLDQWRTKLLEHLKEFNPATYRGLKQAGKLETYLDRKVDEAARAVENKRLGGMQEAEAISDVMREWLPTPEPESDPPMDPQELQRLHAQIAQD